MPAISHTAPTIEPTCSRPARQILCMLGARVRPSWSTLFFLFAAFALACAGPGAVETACSGLAARRVGITSEEYEPCATEIISKLDTLQRQLRSLVRGDSTVRSEARATHRRLRRLIRQVDWTDPYAETLLRWPDERIRSFNSDVVMVWTNYSGTVQRPGEDSFSEGSRIHVKAKRLYEQIW